MAAKKRLIFPLDVPHREQAMAWVEKLRNEVGLFKVGLELFLGEGPKFLEDLAEMAPEGYFLDLKLHDIPTTVQGALRQLVRGARFTTVHVDQGRKALKATVDALKERVAVLGVTVLTSLTPADLVAQGIDPRYATDPPIELVLLRAGLAYEAGCAGVVCAGSEARAVKEKFGDDFLVVCPGIRPSGAPVPADDQRRIMTPYEAIQAGADYVVVGRPIRLAPDPVARAREVVADIARGLAERPSPPKESERSRPRTGAGKKPSLPG
uniref:Orotidine 5'-phosphate decarboxylase n=1 Tax=Desulfobacca acetoxidans TaxID=60893 RepID=A0A7C5AKR6_9BACT